MFTYGGISGLESSFFFVSIPLFVLVSLILGSTFEIGVVLKKKGFKRLFCNERVHLLESEISISWLRFFLLLIFLIINCKAFN